MTEDTLNIEEIKMHNKTISKILVAIIMTSMLIAIIPNLSVGATTLTSINPTSGNVGTTVTVIGTIDTQGGAYQIEFDGGVVKTGNAPANQYNVNDTFVVPASLGSDAGLAHVVGLRDISTTNVQTTSFAVITKRTITTAPYDQEGDTVAVTITVTGGTLANTVNSYTVGITNPAGTMYVDSTFSFTTDGAGSGSVVQNFPSGTFTAGASTNWTGTYAVVANRTLPGVITNAVSTSFVIGLTDKASYARFETVNVQTSGWTPNQNISVVITDPSSTPVTVPWPAEVNVTTGFLSANWTIPLNAPMGTYTVTAVNTTGNDKAVSSTQTFTIGSANLAVAYTVNPSASYNRTDTVAANFTITYPDSTLYNATHFSSITVTAYYNTTVVGTLALTAANYDSATGTWLVSWKIPRNAVIGNGYKFHLEMGDIADVNGNTGPTAAVPSGTFAITPADLTVMVTQQPAANYTRTSTAMAKINITYPDNSFFTDADLGSALVRAYRNGTNFANITLMAANFNNVTNDWNIEWTIPYDTMLGTGYNFTVLINEVMDAPAIPNMGPTANVATDNFEILAVDILANSLQTDSTSYRPGEYVSITFVATYADGAPVLTGTSTVTLTAPDTFTTATYNPVPTAGGTFAVTVWLSDAQAQVGSWNVTLGVNGVNDGAGNSGPATMLTTSFTVLPAEVSLESILDAINDLDSRLNSVEADTSSLGSQISTLYSAVQALETVVDDIEAQLDSLSSTAATTTDVAAVSSSVSSLSSSLASLESKLNTLQSAVANAATDSDVAAVNAAVDEVSADVAALESSLADLNTAINAIDAASPAEVNNAVDSAVDAATDDLSSEISGISTLVIVAIVLALIAAAAAIAAVYIIQRKIAG
jgi:phage shock protein A